MKRILLSLLVICLFGGISVSGAQFDVNFSLSGTGYSSATMTARTLSAIQFTAGSYSINPNTSCTEPFTIVRDGVTVLSTLASEGKIQTEVDDVYDEEETVIRFQSHFNQAGTYIITAPEGFFRRSNGDTSNSKEVVLTLNSPVPSSFNLVVDNNNVELTAGSDNTFTAQNVAVTGAGSVKLQGSTYYGAVNGQPTDITIGEATPIGYNGKLWSVPVGTYNVTVNWNENNPTVTFANAAPAVQTFNLGISVQGATPQNTATDFQLIDLPASFTTYGLNSDNSEPITVMWGEEELFSIDRTSSKLLAMDEDYDWEDDAYMINLGERINRVGEYTITVPQGFFKSGSKVNASISKTVTVTSPIPSMLSIKGKSGSLEADVDMTLEGSVFTAQNVNIKGSSDEFGEIQLMGETWYGVCNNVSDEVTPEAATPVGYNGGYWKVPIGLYNVVVDWTDGNPTINFKDRKTGVEITFGSEPVATYYTLQGVRINNPLKGQILIEIRNGKASKIVY